MLVFANRQYKSLDEVLEAKLDQLGYNRYYEADSEIKNVWEFIVIWSLRTYLLNVVVAIVI